MMDHRSKILGLMTEIAAEHHKRMPPLTDDLVLNEFGFDSLCFAILVARLEDELGVDPFSSAEEAYFPTTLGEFIEAYDAAPAAHAHAA